MRDGRTRRAKAGTRAVSFEIRSAQRECEIRHLVAVFEKRRSSTKDAFNDLERTGDAMPNEFSVVRRRRHAAKVRAALRVPPSGKYIYGEAVRLALCRSVLWAAFAPLTASSTPERRNERTSTKSRNGVHASRLQRDRCVACIKKRSKLERREFRASGFDTAR